MADNTLSIKPMTAGTSVAAGASIELLGFEMDAMLEVTPTGGNQTVRALVMPGMGIGPQTVTFDQMFKSVEAQFKVKAPTDSLTSVLNFVGIKDPNDLIVRLNQAFLLYDSSMASGNMEFAFSISFVNASVNPDAIKAFQIKSISFGLWNSSRPNILKTMGMGGIDKFLLE